jgi:taurine---2-oxoglutarate transaminase
VEHAVRMARLHTGRQKVLAAYRSYHGATSTSINLTGDPRRWPNDIGTSGVVHFFGPFLYRSVHASDRARGVRARPREPRELILFEGPSAFAAIILETIPGTAGIMVPPEGFLEGRAPALRPLRHRLHRRRGDVWLRTHRQSWFAYQRARRPKPDLVTFAKGVNSGYVPLGGVVLNEAISATFNDRVYPGGLTYSGHPLACAAAVATIEAMQDEHIVENAQRIGDEVLRPGLEELAARSTRRRRGPRARGLLRARPRERSRDQGAARPLRIESAAMNDIVAACRDEGLLIFNNFHRLHVVPPCNVSDDEAREGLARLDRALAVADRHYTGGQ